MTAKHDDQAPDDDQTGPPPPARRRAADKNAQRNDPAAGPPTSCTLFFQAVDVGIVGALPDHAVKIYAALCRHLPNVHPSQQRLRKMTGKTNGALNRGLKVLVACGLVARRKRLKDSGDYATTCYRLHDIRIPSIRDEVLTRLQAGSQAAARVSHQWEAASPIREASRLPPMGDKASNRSNQKKQATAKDDASVAAADVEQDQERTPVGAIADPPPPRLTWGVDNDPPPRTPAKAQGTPTAKGKRGPRASDNLQGGDSPEALMDALARHRIKPNAMTKKLVRSAGLTVDAIDRLAASYKVRNAEKPTGMLLHLLAASDHRGAHSAVELTFDVG